MAIATAGDAKHRIGVQFRKDCTLFRVYRTCCQSSPQASVSKQRAILECSQRGDRGSARRLYCHEPASNLSPFWRRELISASGPPDFRMVPNSALLPASWLIVPSR